MHPQGAYADKRTWPALYRLGVVAATLLAGLMACGALLAVMSGPVPAALAAGPVIYPSLSAPCNTTLQACIDGTTAGATIQVQAGTYVTNGLTLNKAVSLTGVSRATVILHALPNQRVLTVTGALVNSSVIISGLTFADGHAVGGACPAGCGGALLITDTAQPLLVNLIITGSLADHFGGGLYADTGSPLVMSGVVVRNNSASSRGGGASAQENVTLNGGAFEHDQCTGLCSAGGGLFANGNLTLTGTQFLNNASVALGGGAIVNGSATLNGGLFQNNQCTGSGCGGGGGLLVNRALTATNTQFLNNIDLFAGGARAYGNVTLNGGLFENNQCVAAGCQGGGLSAGNLAVTLTEFLSNTSVSDGGGAVGLNVTLNGARFQNNQCTGAGCDGGGLFTFGDLSATNSSFLNNQADSQGGGSSSQRNVTLNGGVYANNQSRFGGGLFAGLNITATHSQFLSNTSADNGGGLITLHKITIDGGLFQGNRCTNTLCRGGGLVAGNGMGITDTLFLSNIAQQGGALFAFSGNGRLVNDLFASNTAATGQGEALFLNSPGAVTVLFTTIAQPTAGGGSAIYVTSGTVGITDTLIASYTIGIELAGGAVHEDYNLFSGVAAPLSPAASLGPHTHIGPSGFANPVVSNYHLRSGSAAIDAGVDSGVYFDIDGDPRPLGKGFDIGFDELNIRHLFLPLLRR